MKRLKFISHFVVEALCVNLSSLPPKEAMEPFVCRDIIDTVICLIYLDHLREHWNVEMYRGVLRTDTQYDRIVT